MGSKYYDIQLAGIEGSQSSDERPLFARVSEDLLNPIAVLYTDLDREGSTFDLRKALLLRRGHGLTIETLRNLAAFINNVRCPRLSQAAAG
jgi:hypothetical protein